MIIEHTSKKIQSGNVYKTVWSIILYYVIYCYMMYRYDSRDIIKTFRNLIYSKPQNLQGNQSSYFKDWGYKTEKLIFGPNIKI